MMSVTAVIQATGDTDIRQIAPTTNYGSGTLMWIGELNNATDEIRRLLVWFNLASIPAGSTITSATLSLYYTGTHLADTGRTFHIYRLVRSWVELEATWNRASTAAAWGTAGADNTTNDYADTSLGTIGVDTTLSAQWRHATLSTSIISQMVDGTLMNEGFLIRRVTGSAELNDAYQFRSRENTTTPGAPAWAPYLTIEYIPPGGELQVVIC